MRVLICDDEFIALDSINKIISQYFIKHNISSKIITESDSTKVMAEQKAFDMAILDVEMPSYSGLEIARHLMTLNRNTIIFIITSHDTYLDNAMDLRVFRFLPKPIDKERIYSGLDSAIKLYNENTRVLLTDGSTSQRVYVRDILFITISKRKTLVVTVDDEIISDRSLVQWKDILPSACFAQPHYSYLVNLRNIERLDKNLIILKKNNGESVKVTVSQRKYKDFNNRFLNYIAQENF